MTALTIDKLVDAVDRGVAAFRVVTRLTPAGGPGDKVFPPTYAVEDRAQTKYALEKRRVDGHEVTCVLLDSVASQANRMELALLEGWERGELAFPVMSVDFTGDDATKDLGKLTVLEAPHRIADALFRDSMLDNKPFRTSNIGQAFTEATPNTATPVYTHCPTGLVFGVWDSTGPKGGLGAKYARALVSEIVGYGATLGVKTASRIDPAGIEKGVKIYQHEKNPNDWTVTESEAAKKKGSPELFARSAQDKGKPSGINHGNVAPTIETKAGGVTIDYATQTTVLSLAALRRLRFTTDVKGEDIAPDKRREAEKLARTNLAALALAAIAYQREEGYDLRSRCLLVPDGPLCLEAIPSDGGEPVRYTLTTTDAAGLLEKAQSQASDLDFAWPKEQVVLKPAPKLVELIRQSRDLTKQRVEDE